MLFHGGKPTCLVIAVHTRCQHAQLLCLPPHLLVALQQRHLLAQLLYRGPCGCELALHVHPLHAVGLHQLVCLLVE